MKECIVFILLGCSYYTFSQDVNPWKSIGKEAPEILTLSNGKYPEIFENDSIRIISGIVYNTVTQRVIGFIETDTLYSEATLEPEIVSRWLSTDPLAKKYPSHSPYNFVGNMPIIAIDPDGRKIYIVVGKTEDGKDIKIRYIPGMNSSGLGEFAKNTIDGLNYIHQQSPEQINYLSRTDHKVNIIESETYTADSKYQPDYGDETTLTWNDNEVVTTQTDNLIQSTPIEILAHEIDHADKFVRISDKAYNASNSDDPAWSEFNMWAYNDKEYMEKEEMRAINGLEKTIRKSLGKTTFRTNHDGFVGVGYTDNTSSHTSKTPTPQDVQSKIDKTNNGGAHFLEKKKTIPMVGSEQ